MEWGSCVRFGVPAVAASLACAVCAATISLPPVAGVFGVRPAAAANGFINIIDNAITLTPTASDYSNDYVEVTGATGLRVDVKSNSPTGLVLFVKCADAAPRIALTDFLTRTLTAPGTGGSSMTSYTAVTSFNQALWSTGVPQGPFEQVNIDVRIKNLFGYTDAISGGTSAYTNTLTFTVVVQ